MQFDQNTSTSGHFPQQRKLGMVAQKVDLEEIMNSKLRRRQGAIVETAETAIPVKFQGQTFKVAGYCVRRKV